MVFLDEMGSMSVHELPGMLGVVLVPFLCSCEVKRFFTFLKTFLHHEDISSTIEKVSTPFDSLLIASII